MNSVLDCQCTVVNILLSVDAGLSFDNLLDVVMKTPPDGVESVSVLEWV